jgi:hypothetical protein
MIRRIQPRRLGSDGCASVSGATGSSSVVIGAAPYRDSADDVGIPIQLAP